LRPSFLIQRQQVNSPAMPEMKRIALIVSWNLAYCRAILRGARRYAANRPDWLLTPVDPEAASARVLRALRPTGILAHVYEPRLTAILRRIGRPAVNVSGVLADTALPRVGIDDVAVGRHAAEHFMDRGVRHFGFVGHARHAYSIRRLAGFREAVERRGFRVDVYEHPSAGSRPFDTQGKPWSFSRTLQRWLKRLHTPVGILACNDIWGVQLTEACRQIGKRVPEDMAILGVDNDDMLCELARPSLSSVAVPGEQIGFRAMGLLESMMNGKRGVRNEPILLPPRPIVMRQSTDLIASDDADVASAVRLIREKTSLGLCVEDVLSAVPVGRRSLERRFRAVIGRGIWAEIRRNRIETARRLLSDTALAMPEVARQAGFTSAKQLSLVFRQELQTTPTQYRSQIATGRRI
jgi:LacI family transcriptional regulator